MHLFHFVLPFGNGHTHTHTHTNTEMIFKLLTMVVAQVCLKYIHIYIYIFLKKEYTLCFFLNLGFTDFVEQKKKVPNKHTKVKKKQ